MSLGKINGPMLQPNLERQGINIALDANLTYWDVNNRYVGIRTTTPNYPLDISGNAHLGNLYIQGNTISVDSGYKLNLGNIANITIGGGSSNTIMYTDGTGNIGWGNLNLLASLEGFTGNNVQLGSNVSGALVSNAVSLTTTTDVTDAISQLNYVLGKLVPPSPPNFPNSISIAVATTNTGLMCNFTQTDNSGWGNLSVVGGTYVSTLRASSFSTSGTSITNVGPGNSGTVTAYINGTPNGNVTLTGTNSNTTNGNLYVYSVEDYHSVLSSVTAGFWYVFSTYATATAGTPAGWNRVSIYDSGTGASTNNATWYYDSSSPSTPAFSATSMVLSSNVVQYSSTIPMFTTSAGFTLKGNVTNLSGDTYPNSLNLFYTESSGGAFGAPAQITLASAGITLPMPRNSSNIAQFTTTSNIVSGFSSAAASSGPSVQVYNNYSTGTQTFLQGNIILYKTGTSNQIEETSITNSYTSASAAYRIVNPDAGTAADNPAYTGSESAFNSTTGPFYTTDATNVSSKIQFDQTNYSTGYLPVGPNLSGHSSSQYFTFKWVKSAVSKFNISYSGTIAGLWVALPGVTDPTYASPTNGWLNMATAYAGSGVPGTGTGGNGSTGCSTGGAAVLNSLVSGGSYTCTFGTVSSTTSTNNEIYIRVKLTSGQSLTALSIVNPTN
jgi:hypothetical protein